MKMLKSAAAVAIVFLMTASTQAQFGQTQRGESSFGNRPQFGSGMQSGHGSQFGSPGSFDSGPDFPSVGPFTPPSHLSPEMGPQYEYVTVCQSCNKEVPNDVPLGMKCPNCGVIWGSDPTRGDSSGNNASWTREIVRFGIFAVIIIGSLIGFVIRKVQVSN